MLSFVRDPRYYAPFAVLVLIIVVSALMRGSGSGEASRQAVAPTATPTAGPVDLTPVASHTPGLDEVLLDSHRAFDLATIGDALKGYHDQNGAYPTTGGAFQLLCGIGSNAGCALRPFTKSLAVSDGFFAYWYVSDGKTFTVFSHVETQPQTNDCPATVPSALAGGHVLCIVSKGAQ